MPLRVLIVGGGIAGLSTAIALTQYGHTVTVLERRPAVNLEEDVESGSGIQLQPTATPILKAWGLLEGLKSVAHDNTFTCLRTYSDGSTIAYLDFSIRAPAWYVRRGALRAYLLRSARERGVEVREGQKVTEQDFDRPAAILENGDTIEADLLVGADGTWSRVRSKLNPDFAPQVLDGTVFQISLDLEKVKEDEELAGLLDGPRNNVITCGPGCSIFASPAPFQGTFDVQLFVHDYPASEDPSPRNGYIRGLQFLRERFSSFHPAVGKALASTDSAYKWRLATCSGVPSWSHKNGKVVLVGDAIHGMTPFAGQGTYEKMVSYIHKHSC
jgi:salicylate hydroxylase